MAQMAIWKHLLMLYFFLLLLLAYCQPVQAQQGSTTTTVTQTKIWINTVSGYSSLSSCAEGALSTIVRGQASGCGNVNTYLTNSYSCFCTDSSSYMSHAISTDVIQDCATDVASTQASSAIAVFDAYCALGVDSGLVTQAGEWGVEKKKKKKGCGG